MRELLALAGWADSAAPAEAWTGVDAAGRPLLLAHTGDPAAVATNEQRTVHVALTGTLYNARQLRTGLGVRHALSGRDDAEVVAHLYEERGVQCVRALRGAFALVLWDARRQRLLLARDQLGLRPLYHATDGGRLAAASTLPALLAIPGLAGTWDAAAVDAFLTLGSVPPPATFYTAIRQLAPGELALWEDGRLRSQRYWQLTFPERRITRQDVPVLVREQVREALRLRQAGMMSGLLLSGGLGAVTLLALAREEQRLPVGTYTAVLPGADGAENEAAAALAAQAGVEHATVTGECDWAGAIDGLLAAHGGPVGDLGTLALQRAAARAAADVGVVLAGVGGEQIFGGSPVARAAERLRRYRRLPQLAREGAQLWARVGPPRWAARTRRLVEEERLAPLEMYARVVTHLPLAQRRALYAPETLEALGEHTPWAALGGLFADAASAGATDPLDAMHYVALTLGLPAEAGAAHAAASGLDLRLPLADHRLAQFAASVPPALRGNAAQGQLLLRAAMKDLLPPALVRAPHASATAPERAWRTLLDEMVWPVRIAAQGFFRHDAVERLRREHLAGTRDHSRLLWAIIVVTRWLERQPTCRPEIHLGSGPEGEKKAAAPA